MNKVYKVIEEFASNALIDKDEYIKCMGRIYRKILFSKSHVL